MHILFYVLKIAGISVGFLLLFLIFLLILLLFIPFQYRIYGKVPKAVSEKEHIEWKQLEAKLKISFLFILFQLIWEHKENKSKMVIRILGMKITSIGEKKEKKFKNTVKETTSKNNVKKKRSEDDIEETKMENEKNRKEAEEPDIETQQKKEQQDITYIENRTVNEKEFQIKHKKSKNILSTIIKSPMRFVSTAKAVWGRFQRLQQLKGDIIEKTKQIADIWNDEHVRNGISMLWKKGKAMGMKLKPRSIQGYLHFGLADPADTGRVLGAFSVAYAFIGDTIRIDPDFEKLVFDGELEIRGRIPVFSLIRIVWKLYWDKEVRYALKKIRKIRDL